MESCARGDYAREKNKERDKGGSLKGGKRQRDGKKYTLRG